MEGKPCVGSLSMIFSFFVTNDEDTETQERRSYVVAFRLLGAQLVGLVDGLGFIILTTRSLTKEDMNALSLYPTLNN